MLCLYAITLLRSLCGLRTNLVAVESVKNIILKGGHHIEKIKICKFNIFLVFVARLLLQKALCMLIMCYTVLVRVYRANNYSYFDPQYIKIREYLVELQAFEL